MIQEIQRKIGVVLWDSGMDVRINGTDLVVIDDGREFKVIVEEV